MKRPADTKGTRRWALAAVTATAGLVGLASTPAQAQGTVAGFKSSVTLLCLDSSGNGHVYTLGCGSNNNHQLWSIEYGVHATMLRNVATGLCLDSNGAGSVYTSGCDANNHYQNWYLNPDSATHMQDVATGRCLDSNEAGSVYTSECYLSNRYQIWV